jgi:hypothetical protein
MLLKFDQARLDKDYDNMNVRLYICLILKRYAHVLSDFNGGTSCIQTYLNQNDFFIERVMEDVAALAEEDQQ